VVGTEDEESQSQVVPLDEDAEAEADESAETVARPAPKKGKTKAKPAPSLEDEEGLDLGIDTSLEEGEGEETEGEVDEDEEGVVQPRQPLVEAPPAQWGVVPALMMIPCVIVLFVVGLMGFELIQGMWGYHQSSKVSRPVINFIARSFDDTLPKE